MENCLPAPVENAVWPCAPALKRPSFAQERSSHKNLINLNCLSAFWLVGPPVFGTESYFHLSSVRVLLPPLLCESLTSTSPLCQRWSNFVQLGWTVMTGGNLINILTRAHNGSVVMCVLRSDCVIGSDVSGWTPHTHSHSTHYGIASHIATLPSPRPYLIGPLEFQVGFSSSKVWIKKKCWNAWKDPGSVMKDKSSITGDSYPGGDWPDHLKWRKYNF